MQKRGQVTLFIIIAIIIVALVLLFILLQGGLPGQELSQSDLAKVKSYLDDCFKQKTQAGILAIAKQGGYNKLPEGSINFLDERTAYYLKNDQLLTPSVTTVSEELNSWLNDNVQQCLLLQGYEISSTSCKAAAKSEVDFVTASFACPVTVKKGLASSQISSFSAKVNMQVPKMLDVSSKIIAEYRKAPDYVCIECYDKIASDNNVTIKIVPITKEIYEPEHIWFLITDKNIKFDDKNITWRFVVES